MTEKNLQELQKLGFTFICYFKDGKFIIESKSRTGNLAITEGCSDYKTLEERIVDGLYKMIQSIKDSLGEEAAKTYI